MSSRYVKDFCEGHSPSPLPRQGYLVGLGQVMLDLDATANTGIHFNTISHVALKFTSVSLFVIKDESLTRRLRQTTSINI